MKFRKQTIYYLCNSCAKKLGWRMSDGHCCTMHIGKCDVCKQHKCLACENDYLKRREQKDLTNWD